MKSQIGRRHQDKLPFQDNSPESIMSQSSIIDEILDIGHCEEPDWKARKKSSQHQDKPVGLPFQDNSPESIMSQKIYQPRQLIFTSTTPAALR